MGQKTHPLGFRLGITLKHKSFWFSTFKNYWKLLKEDDQIRTYFKPFLNKASISNILIYRYSITDNIDIRIETARPGILIGEKGVGLELLSINLKKILAKEIPIRIRITEIKNADLNVSLLGDYITEQLEKRVPFRRAISKALQRAEIAKVKGIKIQVSGRLNGVEMARSEWIRTGRLPLQTLKADIDYGTKEANTIFGIMGVKIWLFRNEKN